MTAARSVASVTVVSSRRLYRDALTCILSHLGCVDVVGECDTVQEAILGRPDLVTVAFADGSGVAVVTGAQLLQWIDDCGAPVATPVLGWDAEPTDLECLVRVVLAGRLPTPCDSVDRLAPLTPREVEILGLLGAGWSREDISEALGISLHTVRTHLGRVNAKLGVQSSFEAVALARGAGLRALREEQRC